MSRRVAVVVDSSAQLSAPLARRHGVEVVPVAIVLDGESHDETVLDPDEVYERVAAGADISTATPGPGAFLAAYARAAAGGAREVVSLHVDGRLSGVADAARIAAGGAPVPVHVVDTGQAGYGVALCALEAVRALDARAGAVPAVSAALRLGAGLRNASFVAVAPPGRVAARDAVVEVVDGVVTPVVPVTGPGPAVDRVVDLVLAAPRPVEVAVGHASVDAQAHADRLAAELARRPSVRDVGRYRVGPSVGAHVGPAAFGCFWWPARDAAEPIRRSA